MNDYDIDSGHFSLSLNASQSKSLPKISHSIAKVSSLLKDYSEGFTANAIRNLLGTFHFYNNSPDKALQHFQHVLRNDEFNINALSNQIFVYKRLFRNKKADEIRSLLETARKTNPCCNVIKDAEFGFAYLFDCYENNIRPRWQKCTEIFEHAIDRMEKIAEIDLAVSIQIKFWTMQSYQKRYDTDIRDQKQHVETFNKSVKIIKEIQELVKSEQINDKMNHLTISNIKAVLWAYLGLFLSKKPSAKWNDKGLIENDENDIPDIVRHCGLEEYLKDPKMCFENALKENKNNREVRIRFANYLRNFKIDENAKTEENKDRLSKAMEHVNHSLELDSTEANWFGRSVRAEIFFSLYRIYKDKTNLEKAIEDWEKAIDFCQTAWNFKKLADAYVQMATKDGTQDEIDFEKDGYITKASIYFWKSVQSLGTQKTPEVHRSHGRFLRSLGDKRESIECFKRAIEIDTAHKPTKSFENLFETFLQMYEEQYAKSSEFINGDEHKIELQADRLLYEIAFWFRFAIKNYYVFRETEKMLTRSQSVYVDVGNTTALDDIKHDQTADLLKDHTIRFTKTYKRGMAHLCEHFKTVSEGSSNKIAKLIENNVPCLTEDMEWKQFQEEWTKRRAKMQVHKGLTSCPTCGNLTDKMTFSDPPEKARNEYSSYDFYVIYPDSQREWVLYSLLQKLEGINGFKGAILERDAIPGSNTFNSMRELISKSHRILAIMTREFYSDRWCMHSLDTAEEISLNNRKDNFVIPILLESDKIPDRFNTVICLDVVDFFDWDKLVRAMSQR